MDNLTPEEIKRLKSVAAKEERRQAYMKKLPLLVGIILLAMVGNSLAQPLAQVSPVLALVVVAASCIALPVTVGYMMFQGWKIYGA